MQNIPGLVLVTGYILIGAGCVCLLLGLMGVSCGAIPGWAVYLGQISYGLYVFQWFDLSWVSAALDNLAGHLPILRHATVHDTAEVSLALVVTIGVAAVSYRFYEYRFLKLKERFALIKSRP